MIAESVATWAAKKVLDGVLGHLLKKSQRDALIQVLKQAREDLRRQHPNVHAHLHEHGDWEMLWEAAAPLLQRGGIPDMERLESRIRQDRANVPADLRPGLETLFRQIHNFMCRHPGLVDLQTVTLLDGVRAQLEQIKLSVTGLTDPDDIVAAIRPLAQRRVDNHLHWCDAKVTETALPDLTFQQSSERVSLDNLALLAAEGRTIIVKGEPGLGKTTLLLELARWLPTVNADTATFYVSLPEWALGSQDIFTYLATQAAFAPPLGPYHLQLLALHGRLTLLFDSWNEVMGERRERADRILENLERDYPLLALVIATRQVDLLPPEKGAVILEAHRLSEAQREALVRDRLSENADAFIEHVRGTTALDAITRIPLYLVTAIDLWCDGTRPSNRESLIAEAVTKIDLNHQHDLGQLDGVHHRFLDALAFHMMAAGTSLDQAAARQILQAVRTPLHTSQGVCEGITAPDILRILVAHHLVVHEDDKSVRFQHQLFQEWFASFHVADLASRGDVARNELLDILDQANWSEAVAFAVERLASTKAEQAAAIIEAALEVEPVYAAGLVRLAGDAVWELVSARFRAFADSWHQPGIPDRALTFMIATGRPDFAHLIRPFLANENSQIQLTALRAVRPFPAFCLGADWQDWYLGLPDQQRKIFATDSRFEPLSFFVELASVEPNPKIVADIVEALDYHGANRQIRTILSSAYEDTWGEVVRDRMLYGFKDQDYLDRRLTYLRERARTEDDVVKAFSLLSRIKELGFDDLNPWLAELISSRKLPIGKRDASNLLTHAARQDPVGFGNAVAQCLVRGETPWYDGHDASIRPDPDHQKSLTTWLLGRSRDSSYRTGMAVRLLGAEALRTLCEACLKGHIDPHALIKADPVALATALITCQPTNADEAAKLVSILASFGPEERESPRLPFPPDLVAALRVRLLEWPELAGDGESRRSLKADVALTLARMGLVQDITLIRGFLIEELEIVGVPAVRFVEWNRTGRRGPDPRNILYLHRYTEAARALHCLEMAEVMIETLSHPTFAENAARVLLHYHRWEEMAQGRKHGYTDWGVPDFAMAIEKRTARQRAGKRGPASSYATAVIDQAMRWRTDPSDDRNRGRARNLAALAASLDFGDRYDDILTCLDVHGTAHPPDRYGYLGLALAGEAPPIEPIMAGYQAAALAPDHGRDNRSEALQWLDIMLLSDHPAEAIPHIKQLAADHRSWHDLGPIFTILGHIPGLGAGALLADLAKTTPALVQDIAWAKAMATCRDAGIGEILLRLLQCPEVCTNLASSSHNNPIYPSLVRRSQNDKELRNRILDSFTAPPCPEAKPVLAYLAEAFAMVSRDEEAVIAALALLPAPWGTATWTGIHQAVKSTAVWSKHLEGNLYELVPSPANALRATLLRIANGQEESCQSARQLLGEIDLCRDEYGLPLNGRRHPDLHSGFSWPL